MIKSRDSEDTIYRNNAGPDPFLFNEQVVRVFPDMINRSVPGYADILQGIGLLTRRYVQEHSRCYDLGCSLGAATLQMRHNIVVPGVEIVAVDSSPAMIQRCRSLVDEDSSVSKVLLLEKNIEDIEISRASVVVSNFTLQFIAPENRYPLMKRIFEGMLPGGILLISEKLSVPDEAERLFLQEIHTDFKRRNGYSDLEIARKRQALENVLVPWSSEEYTAVMKNAGFGLVVQWYQYFQFAGFAAVKL
ncbi:carboxy-S-adenosyl-L-methionine synthase CmoA [Spirochaeta dissipatitropha]